MCFQYRLQRTLKVYRGGSGKNSFVTLHTSDTGLNDELYLTVSGFEVNKVYTFRYSVLSASITVSQNDSPFGESAKVEIRGASQQVVTTQTTPFGNNHNKWIKRFITFVAPTSTLHFTLSGKTAGNNPGFVNFDIDKYPYDCEAPANVQVELGRTTIHTPFYNDHLNLSTVEIKSTAPTGLDVIWKLSPNSTDPSLTDQEAAFAGISNKSPANVKPYYAFYCKKDLNCHSVSTSQAALNFMYEPTLAQVPLKSNLVQIPCGGPTGDLTTMLNDPLAPVIWLTTNDHQGIQVENPAAAPPGDYYAYYYDINRGGYALPPGAFSTALVKVENLTGVPDLGPTVNINSLIFPANGNKDFVVKIQNIKAENSSCSVFFKILKMPGFAITYSPDAGQSAVNGGIANNNDRWTFAEDNQYITVTSKYGIPENGYSYIGFKITRNANTPAGTKQNLNVTIPLPGGGGETNVGNNQTINWLTTN